MLIEQLNLKVIESRQGYFKVEMPVTDHVKQPFGFLHGGASLCLCDTTAQLATKQLTEQSFDTRNINIHHLSSVREGLVIAEARLIHHGRTSMLWRVDVYNEEHRHISTADCTIAIEE